VKNAMLLTLMGAVHTDTTVL